MSTPPRPPLYPVGYLAVIERSVSQGRENEEDDLVFEDRVEVARVDEVSWNAHLETYDYITTVNPGTPDEFRNRCMEESLRPPFIDGDTLDLIDKQSTAYRKHADETGESKDAAPGHAAFTANALLSLTKSYRHLLKERETLRNAVKHYIKHEEDRAKRLRERLPKKEEPKN